MSTRNGAEYGKIGIVYNSCHIDLCIEAQCDFLPAAQVYLLVLGSCVQETAVMISEYIPCSTQVLSSSKY